MWCCTYSSWSNGSTERRFKSAQLTMECVGKLDKLATVGRRSPPPPRPRSPGAPVSQIVLRCMPSRVDLPRQAPSMLWALKRRLQRAGHVCVYQRVDQGSSGCAASVHAPVLTLQQLVRMCMMLHGPMQALCLRMRRLGSRLSSISMAESLPLPRGSPVQSRIWNGCKLRAIICTWLHT